MHESLFTLEGLDKRFRLYNPSWLSRYEEAYPQMRMKHPLYSQGWYSDAMSPHRFIPRLVWLRFFLKKETAHNDFILDFGTYDGTLVRALRDIGYDAFGQDDHEWKEMWNLLGVENYISSEVIPLPYKAVLAFNCAHRWTPITFVNHIITICGEEPEIIIVDRERRTPDPNNKWWYDLVQLEAMGFEVEMFPEFSRLGEDTARDLLVRKRKK